MLALAIGLLAPAATAALVDGDVTSLLQTQSRSLLEDDVQAYPWAGKNGDSLRTGSARFAMDVNLRAGPAWSFHEEGNGLVRAAPLIDQNKDIYLSTIKGGVYKFAPDGQMKWKHKEMAEIPGVPSIMKGTLFATNARGEVFALNMSTGDLLWRKKHALAAAGDTWSMTAYDDSSDKLVGHDVVVAALSTNGGSFNDYIVGMKAQSGEEIWRFKPKFPVYNSIQSTVQGCLVFADAMGRLYRIKLKDGSLVWLKDPPLAEGEKEAFTTGGAVIGPNGIVYVTSNTKKGGKGPDKGYVTAYSPEDGRVLWRQTTEYPANNAPAVGPLGQGAGLGVVIGVGVNPDIPNPVLQALKKQSKNEKRARILALDALTGKEKWKLELPVWHGWAAGDTLSHICLPDSFGNPAMTADGTVYVGHASGLFYAVHDKDLDGKISESEVSTYDTQNAFQGSPGLAPGMLVATPCNGMHVFFGKQQ